MRRTQTVSLAEAIKEYIRKNRLENGLDSAKIHDVWKDVTGLYISRATIDIKVEHKKLFVKLNSPLLRHEIILIKSELVKRINKIMGKEYITDIIVR
jgi:hypothetical protein